VSSTSVCVDKRGSWTALGEEVLREMSCEPGMDLKSLPPVVVVGSSDGGQVWQIPVEQRKLANQSFRLRPEIALPSTIRKDIPSSQLDSDMMRSSTNAL